MAATVVASDDRGVTFRLGDGRESRIALGHDGRPASPWVTWLGEVAWTDPLPLGAEASVLGYAHALMRPGTTPILLHVASTERDGCMARLVTSAREATEAAQDADGPGEAFEVEGDLAAMLRPLKVAVADGRWRAGDLVAAPRFSCEASPDGSLVATAKDPFVVGNFPDLTALARFIPQGPRYPGALVPSAPPCRVHDLLAEEARARAAREPSEALFAWYREPGRHDGPTRCHVLGSSGLAFHMVDSPEDYFHAEDIEPGLWVLRDATVRTSVSYEGEHDAWFVGDWAPAVPDDLAGFGFASTADLDAELADLTEVDLRPGLAVEAMEAARLAAMAAVPSRVAP